MPNSTPLAALWSKFPLKTGQRWLNLFLLFVPAAIALDLLHVSPLVIFIASALAIAPLASVLGESTGALAAYCGPSVGGILSATMGNATEMIIAFFALRSGHINVVKASLSGSIIGNLLLVLGLSMVVGGSRHAVQRFSRTTSTMNSAMLMIAVAALVMPAVFNLTVFGTLQHRDISLEHLSLWTSGVLILLYLLNMLFVFRTHKSVFQQVQHQEEAAHKKDATPQTSRTQAIIALASATVLIAVMSEVLVDQIAPVTKALGMTELFVGVIVVALVGNAAENSTAILMARQNKMELSMAIATGASTQIALFVAPVLVFLSFVIGHPMTLVFNGFEIAAIILSVLIVEMISADGETNWFEGAQLLAVYAIVAVAFYFVPE
ncbi:MAG TPA: calcium/proton exchanger [Candidatus Angelobacter sp.]|nr:calcium/proton exchanger [Candidatus Angelobacter sp.]